MEDNRNDFSKGSIAGNILSLAVPMTLAQLINVLYSIVDHLYFVRDGLQVAEQKIHPHGHGWSIVNNVDQWQWEQE